MELRVNKEKRELKSHGTYEFPVNISRKHISSYETGAFPWHWHDEAEMTLILSGEIDYRVNDNCYRLGPGFTPEAKWRILTAIIFPSLSTPGFWEGMKAVSSAANS